MGKEQAEGGIHLLMRRTHGKCMNKEWYLQTEVGTMEDVDNMKEEGRSTQCFKTIGVKRH